MLKLSIKCTRFESTYSSCTGGSSENIYRLHLWLGNLSDSVEVLDWSKRFKIAMGSAIGLNFLHHGFIPPHHPAQGCDEDQ
jgi:hypothetical protein